MLSRCYPQEWPSRHAATMALWHALIEVGKPMIYLAATHGTSQRKFSAFGIVVGGSMMGTWF